MSVLFRGVLLLALLLSPLAMGCSSQLSEEETPIVASDEEEADTPVSDADNP